jgi:two-component sensor histidine kinase
VDTEGIIRYVSGVANNLYRRLGYKDALIGRPLAHLETDDERLWKLALAENQCVEQATEEAGRFCIRKVVPLVSYPSPLWCWPFIKPLREKRYGALITLHDDTEQRSQERELQIKNALIQEVHHRVKNNLQTIAGLVRMQTRRTQSDEARTVLNETLHRILSVAVIHEFLSSESSNIINIKEVGYKIIGQLQQGVLDPDLHIQFKVTGDSISLPPRQATACSLILNELLQNAVEHGFAGRNAGVICINLEDKGDEAMISVIDNGHGLPADFQLEQSPTLGLQIVRTLVESDLKGRLQFSNSVEGDEGLSVSITFSKTTGG